MLDVSRTTDTILMVRPYDFGFNEETGLDNEFQQRLEASEEEINTKANSEFQAMVDTLRAEGVTVLILEKPELSYGKNPGNFFVSEFHYIVKVNNDPHRLGQPFHFFTNAIVHLLLLDFFERKNIKITSFIFNRMQCFFVPVF